MKYPVQSHTASSGWNWDSNLRLHAPQPPPSPSHYHTGERILSLVCEVYTVPSVHLSGLVLHSWVFIACKISFPLPGILPSACTWALVLCSLLVRETQGIGQSLTLAELGCSAQSTV